jgi:hypothetical protein
MQLTQREILTALHGMFFGGFFLMAIFGLVVELIRARHAAPSLLTPPGQRLEAAFLLTTAALGWLAVFSGTYIVYPWYRARPAANITGLAAYPRSLLLANPHTAAWHNLGMEWKEHIAFFAPILLTALAFVYLRHRAAIRQHLQLRNALLAFAALALVACGIAATFGALIDKAAPVTGGPTITLIGTTP